MMDFLTMTDDQITTFAAEHMAEMDAEEMRGDEIMQFIQSGQANIVRRNYGFAVIQPENMPGRANSPGLHIWLLYIDESVRNKGNGKRFVKELIAEHGRIYQTSVIVYGGERATFFSRCGFKVMERDTQTGKRSMETWRESRE